MPPLPSLPHKPPRPHPVAPNLPNTLSPTVRRLPLGIPQDDPGGFNMWRIWLPTNTGGVLTLSHGVGNKIWLQKPAKTVLAEGKGELSYTVPDGTFGEFYAASLGEDAGPLTARFTQIGWSRESAERNARPMLPWNFWYWPSKTGSEFAEYAKQVIGRYATSRGKSANEFSKWEQHNHQREDAEDWAGHCHNSAPASMLFEQPVAGTIGESPLEFEAKEEEMEFLAAEYFGNYGQLEPVWELTNRGDPVGERPLPAYFKPGLPKTKATLVAGLTSDLDADVANVKATKEVTKYATEADFTRAVERVMGKLAVGLYDKLIGVIRGEGHLLMANARGYRGADGPESVWNQVFFYYRAIFEETADREDDRDITITCSLYSNIDRFPSPKLPATVSKTGTVTPGSSGTDCQVYRHVWRIVFDEKGKMDPSDARCSWKHLQNGSGQELYPPTSLLLLKPPSFNRKVDRPNMLGNPVVGHEILKYLVVRKRYR